MKGIEKVMEKKDFDYRTVTLDQMAEYIEQKAPQDKEWFKNVAFIDKETKEGTKKQYLHFTARKEFFERYMPELIPVAKKPKKETRAKEILENW